MSNGPSLPNRDVVIEGSSNVATNVAPTTSQTAPAPSGGKGGYNNSPMTMEDFAQQRPQVYMPPAQPTFYDQAFNSSYYNPGFQRPRMDYGLGSMGNAYVRRMPMYSPQTPIEASPPPSEMNYAPGGYDLPPQELMSDSWRRRPRLEPTAPVEATRGVISESNYSGGLGSLISSGLGGLNRNYVPSEAISTSDRRFNPMTGTSGPSKTVYTNADQQRTPYGYVNTSAGSLWNA